MAKDLILCVDDDPMVLRACSIAVAEAGFRVAVAENGAAGWDAFIQLRREIALVLLDIVMPGRTNGIDLANRILAHAPDAKILMMTGYSNDVIDFEGGNRLPLIRKPFLPADLVQKIRFVLGIPEAGASV